MYRSLRLEILLWVLPNAALSGCLELSSSILLNVQLV